MPEPLTAPSRRSRVSISRWSILRRVVRLALLVLLFGTVLNIASAFAIIWSRDRWQLHYIEFVSTDLPAPWPIEPPELEGTGGIAWPAQSDDSGWGVQAAQSGPLRLSWAGRSFEPGKIGTWGVGMGGAGGLVRRWGSATEYESAGPIVHERAFTVDVSEFGWPFAAFRTAMAQRNEQSLDSNTLEIRTSPVERWTFDARGWRPSRFVTTRARLAPEPIWPGVVLNTLSLGLAATALWLGFLRLIFIVRRSIGRFRQRGRTGEHCPQCGYSLAGLPSPDSACPECGTTRPVPTVR